MSEWLTDEVKRALEVCPAKWRGATPEFSEELIFGGHAWHTIEIHNGADIGRYSVSDGVAQAVIERCWREECKRRGVRLQFWPVQKIWTWECEGVRGEGVKPFLGCLADAILATQPPN